MQLSYSYPEDFWWNHKKDINEYYTSLSSLDCFIDYLSNLPNSQAFGTNIIFTYLRVFEKLRKLSEVSQIYIIH